MTEWRDIKDWPYRVSDDGQVFSVRSGKLLRQRNRCGYWAVALQVKGFRRDVNVHILVAEAFIGPKPFIDAEVCHYDNNRRNNSPSNLRWGTHAENVRDQVRQGVHIHGSKTLCPSGHGYDRIDIDGARRCSTCQRQQSKLYYQKRKLRDLEMKGKVA